MILNDNLLDLWFAQINNVMKLNNFTQEKMRNLSKNILIVLSASIVFVGCTKDDTTEPPTPVYDSSVNVPTPAGLSPVSSSAGAGVSDADGNTYTTVVLGNGQEWMAENLKTTKYSNGDAISSYNGDLVSVSITNDGTNYTTGTYNNIPLIGGNGSGATANITVDATGNVTNVTIVNPGSSYLFDDVLDVNDTLLSDTVIGSSLMLKIDSTLWSGLTTGGYTQYEFDNQYDAVYGKLYNYYAVADSRNVCPSGWHVPTNNDWNTLTLYLDPEADTTLVDQSFSESQSTVAGGRLKSTSTNWQVPNVYATDEIHFSAQPSGVVDSLGTSAGMQIITSFWSSLSEGTDNAYTRSVSYGSGRLRKFSENKHKGNAIRCIKD